MSAAIQQKIVEQLRVRPLSKGALRAIIGCSPAELAASVQSLRYQGKLAWDALELSPSMIEQDAAPCAAGDGSAGVCESAAEPSSIACADGSPRADCSQSSGSSKVPEAEDGDVRNTLSAPPSSNLSSEPPQPIQPPAATEAPGSAEPGVRDGADSLIESGAAPSAPSGPDDEDDEDYPGGVNDAAPALQPQRPFSADRHRAGVHAAATRAAAKRLPIPAHEPEVAREVREEAEELRARRNRARSTGTVRIPLDLTRKFDLPDMNFSEAIGSMLSDTPQSVMRAVSRKHVDLWRRCILLGRATGKSPMQALYSALEAGLEQLEPQMEVSDGA
jgi:hypothetical protein